jgi:hypothetical protein
MPAACGEQRGPALPATDHGGGPGREIARVDQLAGLRLQRIPQEGDAVAALECCLHDRTQDLEVALARDEEAQIHALRGF